MIGEDSNFELKMICVLISVVSWFAILSAAVFQLELWIYRKLERHRGLRTKNATLGWWKSLAVCFALVIITIVVATVVSYCLWNVVPDLNSWPIMALVILASAIVALVIGTVVLTKFFHLDGMVARFSMGAFPCFLPVIYVVGIFMGFITVFPIITIL